MTLSTMIRAATIGLILTGQAVSAPEWNLRRNNNGSCSVQPADNASQLGALLTAHPNRKAACEDAKARKAEDASDKTKCSGYSNNTKEECKRDGVDLAN